MVKPGKKIYGLLVAIVEDATAGAILPEMNAYEAAVVNFRIMSSKVYTTDELLAELKVEK